MASTTPSTLLDALVLQLRSCSSTADAVAKPAAILWTDPDGRWRSLVPLLRETLPELLVLGDYAPEHRTGPAIWIRCAVDGGLRVEGLDETSCPIVYLPGVGRQDLRRGDEVPWPLRPLIELQYRGAMWLNNGQDWTVTAFLSSPRTLKLELFRDEPTRQALLRALPELAVTPLQALKGRRLGADDFDCLLTSDMVRDLLRWMGEPDLTRSRMTDETWSAFCSQAKSQFDFDPESDDVTVAGERLGRGDGAWQNVWDRFSEAPQVYRGIAELLSRSQPAELLLDASRWPRLNADEEDNARQALADLTELPHAEACAKVLELESKHGVRRDWVWPSLGQSPIAQLLQPLSTIAAICQHTPSALSADELAEQYVEKWWKADHAACQAIQMAEVADEGLIHAAIRAIQAPWLEASAELLQNLIHESPLPPATDQGVVSVQPGECLVFVDGLRLDQGMALLQLLQAAGCEVNLSRRWSALPSVTATAKPAVTPAAEGIKGDALGEDFAPYFVDSQKAVQARTLRADLQSRGYQILTDDDIGWPSDDNSRGWLETANIDKLGHKLETELAKQLPTELERLQNRIQALFDAGWTKVRIVTDHGWLLLPGGLPKIHLPKHLTQSRWARCAAISGASEPNAPTAGWHWNRQSIFAFAPGISCFNKSPAYAHGGVSLQELVIPDIQVTREGGPKAPAIRLESIEWRGLRCNIATSGDAESVTADLRLERVNGESVANTVKRLDEDGLVSLVLSDDQYEDSDLVAVLLDESGNVLAHRTTKVGTQG